MCNSNVWLLLLINLLKNSAVNMIDEWNEKMVINKFLLWLKCKQWRWQIEWFYDRVWVCKMLMTVMELCYNMQASLKLRFNSSPICYCNVCLFVCVCVFFVCLSHRLYRTQTTQNAVARPPVKTTIARIIVANSDVLRLEPL